MAFMKYNFKIRKDGESWRHFDLKTLKRKMKGGQPKLLSSKECSDDRGINWGSFDLIMNISQPTLRIMKRKRQNKFPIIGLDFAPKQVYILFRIWFGRLVVWDFMGFLWAWWLLAYAFYATFQDEEVDILSDVIEEGEPASKKLKSTMNQVQCKERMVKSSYNQVYVRIMFFIRSSCNRSTSKRGWGIAMHRVRPCVRCKEVPF